MDVQFPRVLPGQLIKSDLFNQLLDEFVKLRDRVTALEGSSTVGDVGIQALVPASGVVKPGDTLGVYGFGFGVSVGVCRVTIDEVSVPNLLPGSSDTQLLFVIPAALESTIPAEGRLAILNVSGLRGTAHYPIRLIPSRLVTKGNVELAFLSATPATISRNPTADKPKFQYSARNLVPSEVKVKLQATFSGVADHTQWDSQISLLDKDGTAIPADGLALGASEAGHAITAAMKAIPATADNSFVLTVSGASADGLVVVPANVQTFKIEVPQPPQDKDIVPTVTSPTLSDGGLVVAKGGPPVTVFVRLHFTQKGNMTVSAPTFSPITGWSSTVTTTQPLPITAVPPAGLDRLISFDVSASAAAVYPGLVTVSITRDNPAGTSTLQIPLKAPTG